MKQHSSQGKRIRSTFNQRRSGHSRRMMLVRVLLVACLALAVNANEQLWNQFKAKHNKSYATEAEHQMRYAVFQSNLQRIQEHNTKYDQGLVSWYLKVTPFADLTQEEFKQMLTAQTVNYTKPTTTKKHVATVQIPDTIDWRDRGVVTGVKNQGGCGSCWTFSATGTLEGLFALKNGYLASLSEQNILDCCTDAAGYMGAGCNGGVVQSGLDYVRDHGIATEDAYPYETAQGSCHDEGVVFQSSGYVEINANDENDLQNAVGSAGPVSVAINADSFGLYGGGIFSDTSCSNEVNHGVLAVGYGNENGQAYWIIKNSWSEDWGETGYVRMAIGYNLCAIASQACYPY